MLYVHRHTIPPNTLETVPLKHILKLTYGIIHKVSIGFPRGCCGLAHLKIYRSEHQIFPTNVEASFAFDNANIEWQEHYPLLGKPFEIELFGWNNDTLFSHTITVRIAVVGSLSTVLTRSANKSGSPGAIPSLYPEYI